LRVVTSGSAYLDIDAYAGCVAYAELLSLQGIEAKAISTAPLNESISETVISWQAPLISSYTSSESDTFSLIDVSDSKYFDDIVDNSRVVEVIDHHVGFEEFWNSKIGDKARIEFIGAACTLVYEYWKEAQLLDKISVLSARLLICGILDNTLNFGAQVSTKRDTEAYEVLLSKSELAKDWTKKYFSECQQTILSDPVGSVQNDTQTISFKSFEKPISFGQLVVWDGQEVLLSHQNKIQEALKTIEPDWFLNLISVGERRSYFVSDNLSVKAWLSKLIGIEFVGSVAVADRLWLRKEVIKQDVDKETPGL
jgi:hypothetical protein